jgi:flagellin-specific chaperone FliS
MSAHTVIQTYHQNNIMSADPLKLIITLYDRAIHGCRQRNLEITWNSIKMLIDSLNMEAKPVADNLLAIYDYCGELARVKDYDKAGMILQELRDTWASLKTN